MFVFKVLILLTFSCSNNVASVYVGASQRACVDSLVAGFPMKKSARPNWMAVRMQFFYWGRVKSIHVISGINLTNRSL